MVIKNDICNDGRVVSTNRVDGPSTRPVLMSNGNRSPVNSGRKLG